MHEYSSLGTEDGIYICGKMTLIYNLPWRGLGAVEVFLYPCSQSGKWEGGFLRLVHLEAVYCMGCSGPWWAWLAWVCCCSGTSCFLNCTRQLLSWCFGRTFLLDDRTVELEFPACGKWDSCAKGWVVAELLLLFYEAVFLCHLGTFLNKNSEKNKKYN